MNAFRPRLRYLTMVWALTLCPFPACAQDSADVVTAVTAGMSCRQATAPLDEELERLGFAPRLDCDYRVGRSLHFAILGVGHDDVTITIFRADFEGDYYVSIGGLHNCVVVKQGKKIQERLLD